MSVPLDSELLEVRDAYLICLYTATQTKGLKLKKKIIIINVQLTSTHKMNESCFRSHSSFGAIVKSI